MMKDRIIGIDLGTSTSEVSYLADGKPEIIPNSLGKAVTPSVVHIKEDGLAVVGEEAAEYLFTRPDCTFMEVKRKTASGEWLVAHGKSYAPEEIQAMLLRYLAGCAEEHLGGPADSAVITVPAYFTDAQRRATVRAGELAGLKVARIVNEPTAAALDFGLSNLTERKKILVFDLGGGTLDITVLELFEGVVEALASHGDNKLGGKDFDDIVMKKLGSASGDKRAAMRLKKAAEDLKIALSGQESHDVNLPFLTADKRGNPVSIERTVTRDEFEGWIRAKLETAKEPLGMVLSDAKLAPSDLDLVLLVGGSTRIPLVRRLVQEWTGLEPKSLLDPDLTVARGAAIQAGIIAGGFEPGRELILTDVCPYTLGIAVAVDSSFSERMSFDPVIPRNVSIPIERSKVYYPQRDYQTEVDIEVLQGESENPENNEKLGNVRLSGIPATRHKSPVEVTFSYDMNGILQVKAKSLRNGKEISADISTAGIKPKPAVDISKWTEAEGARRFRPALRKADKMIAGGEDREDELLTLSNRIKEFLVIGDGDGAEELRQELLETMETFEEISQLGIKDLMDSEDSGDE